MKKSKKPSVRIKRAVKALHEANPKYQIGNIIFEQIIAHGVEQVKKQLLLIDRSKNYFVSPSMFEEAIEILEAHLEINDNDKNQ